MKTMKQLFSIVLLLMVSMTVSAQEVVVEISDFTGVSSPYEEPERPDLLLDTERWDEEECVETLLSAVLNRLK